jgi:hypothetical protein
LAARRTCSRRCATGRGPISSPITECCSSLDEVRDNTRHIIDAQRFLGLRRSFLARNHGRFLLRPAWRRKRSDHSRRSRSAFLGGHDTQMNQHRPAPFSWQNLSAEKAGAGYPPHHRPGRLNSALRPAPRRARRYARSRPISAYPGERCDRAFLVGSDC